MADNVSKVTAVEIESGNKRGKKKRVNGRSSSAATAVDSYYGVLAARNPMPLRMPSGAKLPRRDALQWWEPPPQLPPRNKRCAPFLVPLGLTKLAVG